MDVIERFLKYVSFETTSDENSTTVPSSDKELVLGRYLAEELKQIGLEDARIDEFGYVYASLPANDGGKAPAIGFVSHMDVAPAVSGADIKPRTVHYEGGDIRLNDSVTISEAVYDFMPKYVGQDLIVTDGTTLLGADDKAGVSEIISAVEYIIAHPEIKHGKISIAVTPDEEIGCGADHFDLENFDASYAYTVDGGALGELEYENFNAAGARFTFNGFNIHPGDAKNKMRNAILIANEFISMLPPAEIPAHTEKYEGFFHIGDISGNETTLTMSMLIRDHDMQKFLDRKAYIVRLCDYINAKYGEGTVVPEIHDSYYNMKEKIEPVMYIVDNAKAAFLAAGVEPQVKPIRGGTDGSRLSYEGLPCPNLSTGGENFHGVCEFISVQAMHKMVEVIVNIIKSA